MPNTDQPEQAYYLQMFVQSAELRLLGVLARPELELSCELSNISRGMCTLRIAAVDIPPKRRIGHVDIAVGKPQMRAELQLASQSFDAFVQNLRTEPPRPIALIVALEDTLRTNDHGDLQSPYPTRTHVLDLSWNIPLI